MNRALRFAVPISLCASVLIWPYLCAILTVVDGDQPVMLATIGSVWPFSSSRVTAVWRRSRRRTLIPAIFFAAWQVESSSDL